MSRYVQIFGTSLRLAALLSTHAITAQSILRELPLDLAGPMTGTFGRTDHAGRLIGLLTNATP